MNTRHRLPSIVFRICTAAFLCGATCVSAQTIYKVLDDDGRATFGDRAPARAAIAPRRGARVEVNEAARRLKQAQLQRKQGAEPLPGEFTRDAGTRTVNYRYWRRQEKLRIVVEQAQRRSRETLQPQVAAR